MNTLFDKSLEQQAAEWMDAHPHIMRRFQRLALDAASRGKKFGAKALAERVRWDSSIEGDERWKVPNNHVAYVARELIRRHPHLADYMDTHRTKEE